MSDWEPATDVEAAMRDALRAGDQEHYFRLLARAELILPVDADALAGRAPVGWGTWTTDSRTHVLAFTSSAALDACLAEHAGTFRKVPFHELASSWPDIEWWLAVNPGLPIEGYLPAWFVAQISRGDVRLPGRSLGATARMDQATALRSASPDAARPVPPAAHREPRPASGMLPPDNPLRSGGGRPLSRRAELFSRHGFAHPAPDGDAPPGNREAGNGGGGPVIGTPVTGTPVTGTPVIGTPVTGTPATGTPANGVPANGVSAAGGAPANGAPEHIGAVMQHVTSEPLPGYALSETIADSEGSPRDPGSRRFNSPAADPAVPVPQHAWPEDPAPAQPQGSRPGAATGGPRHADPDPDPVDAVDFTPANRVEQTLLDAVGGGSTDTFLSTLLLAKVLLPGPRDNALANIDRWRTEEVDGQPYVVVFTSAERLSQHLGEDVPTSWVKFTQLINAWPRESLSFSVNPGTPIGATLPGNQIVALAAWAVGEGLTDEQPEPEPQAPAPEPPRRGSAPPASTGPVVMQKTIAARQVPYYLDRGYDRISGFVHRASEVAHLRTPIELYNALGLNYSDSIFKPDDAEVFVLRWAAHRGNLYRIPYGGQNEAAMHAMQGWIIERSPFRGNGFAPSESRDVIAEFKVDSVRLPHGAELWRVDREGNEKLVAMFDADGPQWQRVGEQ